MKTDARRNAIVAAAWEEFREHGFERATMSGINARAGGSKATLYSYFTSKDELFSAAIEHALREISEGPFRLLAQSGPLRERLLKFARADLAAQLSPDMIAVDRILVAEANRASLYPLVREKSFLRRRRIADFLEIEIARGCLRDADPIRAAIHLLALIENDARDRILHGDATVTAALIEEQIHQGVEAFLRAYAPD